MDPTPSVGYDEGTVACQSPSIGDLANRICAAYNAVQNLKPAGYNNHFNFAFVSISQLSEAVRNALANAGVAVMPSVTAMTETPWKNGTRAVVHVDFLFIAAETGEHVTVRQVGVALDTNDKAVAKAIAAATKEMLRRTFLIASALPSEDPDSAAALPDRRWDRFEVIAEIDSLLAATDLGDDELERFRDYVLSAYDTKAWSEMTPQQLGAVRHRLRALEPEERRLTVLAKVTAADAA